MPGLDVSTFTTSVDAIFICGFCDKVALSPQMCKNCQKFHCLKCINKRACPKCNEKFINPSEVLLRFYNALVTECPKCKEKLRINEYEDHVKGCKKVDELSTLRIKVAELMTENDQLKKENEWLKRQLNEKEHKKTPVVIEENKQDHQKQEQDHQHINKKHSKHIEPQKKQLDHSKDIPKETPKGNAEEEKKEVKPPVAPRKSDSKPKIPKSAREENKEAKPNGHKFEEKEASPRKQADVSPTTPQKKIFAATVIQRAFRKRDKQKVRAILAERRQERMKNTANRKMNEEIKEAAHNIKNVIKNLPLKDNNKEAKKLAVANKLRAKK
ncbi:unnamed protein product [Blepharisma stoltei]|uniref:RING-type domain-containing protein n=1 Tax=Blepharisma stoltei TaxID=1481888 RepID=A0AAU9IJH1_9CILI|nr:unnamed protein product [Blepharisma stoltei]